MKVFVWEYLLEMLAWYRLFHWCHVLAIASNTDQSSRQSKKSASDVSVWPIRSSLTFNSGFDYRTRTYLKFLRTATDGTVGRYKGRNVLSTIPHISHWFWNSTQRCDCRDSTVKLSASSPTHAYKWSIKHGKLEKSHRSSMFFFFASLLHSERSITEHWGRGGGGDGLLWGSVFSRIPSTTPSDLIRRKNPPFLQYSLLGSLKLPGGKPLLPPSSGVDGSVVIPPVAISSSSSFLCLPVNASSPCAEQEPPVRPLTSHWLFTSSPPPPDSFTDIT